MHFTLLHSKEKGLSEQLNVMGVYGNKIYIVFKYIRVEGMKHVIIDFIKDNR